MLRLRALSLVTCISVLSVLLLSHLSLLNVFLLAESHAPDLVAATTTTMLVSSRPMLDGGNNNNNNLPIIDLVFHRLTDRFGLVDSLLDDGQIIELLGNVQAIWRQGGVVMRFDEEQALRPEPLDEDRALAYLFYVFGHPRIPPNDRKTNIANMQRNSKWILNAYASFIDSALPALQSLLTTQDRAVIAELSAKPWALEDFRALVGSKHFVDAAFAALAGNLTGTCTPQAFEDALAVADKSEHVQRLHLAFRLCRGDAVAPNALLALRHWPRHQSRHALAASITLAVGKHAEHLPCILLPRSQRCALGPRLFWQD